MTEIPTARVIEVLRANNFTFKRQAPNVNLWRRRGSKDFARVPRRDHLALAEAEFILLIATGGDQKQMRQHLDAWTQG
ncbi:MAG: hypothetical protein OXG19_09710 [Chloroflexi bacterium]|nr:hypothetical protein [Chloroflexota bacterium]